jgi:hypothetical protein
VKNVIFILLFVIVLKPILPVIDYVVNFNYFSKVLCENKVKPKLNCNGKCQLMKELAKASEQEKPINSDTKDNSKQEIEVLFLNDLTEVFIGQNFFYSKTSLGDYYSNLYFHTVCCSVFHPPTFIT